MRIVITRADLVKKKAQDEVVFLFEKLRASQGREDSVELEWCPKEYLRLLLAYPSLAAWLRECFSLIAPLKGAKLRGITTLAGGNLDGANLAGSYLVGASLAGTQFARAELVDADFTDADLEGVSFRGANLKGAKFAGANLRAARLAWADAASTCFIRATLTGAYLLGSNLTGANLEGADLEGADLTRVNFKCANLEGASLTGAKIASAYFQDARRLATDPSIPGWAFVDGKLKSGIGSKPQQGISQAIKYNARRAQAAANADAVASFFGKPLPKRPA